jgi:hypothetical protein
MSTIQTNKIQTLSGQTMGTVLQSQFVSSNDLTSTTSQSGFVVMTAFLTPYFASSRILIMSSLYGSGDDDTNAWMEYQIGSGGTWTRDTTLNGSLNGGSAFSDFSITRAVAEKSIQICGSTQLLVSFNTTAQVGIRVIGSAENTGGFYLNCGINQTPGSYNNISSKSTLVLMEIAS